MKNIWFRPDLNVNKVNLMGENTLVSHIGIEITAIGEDTLEGTMPVDHRTVQPARLLHGGASCVLAETLGSIAANLVIDQTTHMAVGQHIEATHIRSATKGFVKGIAKPIQIGSTTQTWRIEIYNDEGKLLCDSKIIMAIRPKRT
jgi:1,4-dihydroxy-2-naphthoyl-CoA hydrolase